MATTKQTKPAEKITTSLTPNGDLSAITANKKAAQDAYKNAEYKPSDETKAYKKALDDLGDYDSPYSEPINNILSNMQKGYDMNNDPTFKQYQDIYTRNAQEASRDVVARQAALNGGAASSMAQRQAGQAYNNTMQGLYDLVPQLSQQWMNNQQALLSAYQNQDQLDYTKFTDNRTFYQNMYLAAHDRDIDLWNTELTKMYNTIAMYQRDEEMALSEKEFVNEFNRQTEQYGISNAIAWAQLAADEARLKEDQRQHDDNTALAYAQLEEDKRVANMNDANIKAQLAEDQRQHNDNRNLTLTELATRTANQGGGGSSSGGKKINSGGSSSSATTSQMLKYQTTLDGYWAKADNNSQSQNGAISAMADYIADLYEEGKISKKQVNELDTFARQLYS